MKSAWFFSFFLAFTLLFSCKEEATMLSKDYLEEAGIVSHTGVSKSSTEISSDDAIMIAGMYFGRDITTTKAVSSIIDIRDDSGTVQLYAVNYDDEYVLVPATKAFAPVAAICEGKYDESAVNPGEQILIKEMCERIASNRRSGNYDKYKEAWDYYEKKEVLPVSPVNTRASDLWGALQEMQEEWDGRDVYFLNDANGHIPNDIYQSFYATVQQWAQNSACVYPSYSVITVESDPIFSLYGPYTKTAWDQEAPYNSAVAGGYPLGCLTVAIAQVMRSCTLPAGILWSTMPDSTSNSYMSNFLANLRTSLHIDTTGLGYSNYGVSVLNGYGYNCTYNNHSQSTVVSSISDRRLVIMRGAYFENGEEYGHFWVCDGYRYSLPHHIYSLYILVPWGDGAEYYMVDEEEVYSIDNELLHFRMNWGWGGLHNGLYFEEDVEPEPGEDYSSGRHDFIISNRYALYY